MKRNIQEIVSQMTLEEKAGLCSGLDFWRTKSIERLEIPSIMMTDGPIGLRKQEESADHLGINNSIPATCFPSGSALACSWNRELLRKVGIAIGEECQTEGVSIILGPAVNIKRSPLCGRNFEYYSEDPFLSSELAANYINGVQSQGVGTSLKHFAANNQETDRLTIDTIVDERTLREIYLASFEGAVKKTQPWTVMCSYNRLNGVYCSENKYLLTDILKNEWKHEGFVVSDWGAVNERADGLEAGLELEMPSSRGEGDSKIVEAVKSGRISEEILNKAVERILHIIFKAADNRKAFASYNKKEHHKIAAKVAEECMVLLKNENNILPLNKSGSYAVIGSFAMHPRYQGGGSSHINPTKIDTPFDELKKAAGHNGKFTFSKGYELDAPTDMFSSKPFVSVSDIPDERLIAEAQKAASKADIAIIFAGLPESYESEGFDRKHMRMPEGHVKLIEAVSKVQKHVVVVLENGAAVEMPWIHNVEGVLETYLGGQAGGTAVANILFGNANPSGKLAETFPEKLKDNPSYINFPGDESKVEYREGLFVGYRYYDAKELHPLFPFGYGLSYTTFDYSDISVNKTSIKDNEIFSVSVKVKNTGKMTGKEIVQLYVHDRQSSVIRPIKELKGFTKIEIKPGEVKTIVFEIGKNAFAYYNEEIHDWYVESGDFDILIGRSSSEILLKTTVHVESTVHIKKIYTMNSKINDILKDASKTEIIKKYFPNITQMPVDLFGSMPLRSIKMFNIAGNPNIVSRFLDELNK